jgi:hypothetical protein
MNTKTKGDILAERIQYALDKGHVAYRINDIEAALAEYRKPLPAVADPYAELKKAHKEGKQIQIFIEAEDKWRDCQAGSRSLEFNYPPERYRVKPEPVLVPLGPQDVPPGSVFRWPEWTEHAWKACHEVDSESVYFPDDTKSSFCFLKNYGALISRDGGKTWQRCEKEAK